MKSTTFAAVALLAASVHADTATTANPVATGAPSQFLGYRNSSNTQSIRDLGFMGKLANTWILSFGDHTGTFNQSTYDPNPDPNPDVCAFITGRDGGGIQGDDPLSYSDINVTHAFDGNCNAVPQGGFWCPLLEGNDEAEGMGITNVVDINGTHGAIWTLPTVKAYCNPPCPAGAGLAVVTFDSYNVPQCARPFGKSTWDVNEPHWGQLGAIEHTENGIDYFYVYANGYGANGTEIDSVVAARVPKAEVFNLGSYTYYQGNGVWNATRIYTSDLSETSPQNLGLHAHQGGVFYSAYYQRYIYITNGGTFADGDSIYQFYAVAAEKPEGPWSNRVLLFNIDTNTFQPKYNGLPSSYGGFPMPKFFSEDGKTIYFSFSYIAYFEGVVKSFFA